MSHSVNSILSQIRSYQGQITPPAQPQLIEGLTKPEAERNEFALLVAKMRAGGSRRC